MNKIIASLKQLAHPKTVLIGFGLALVLVGGALLFVLHSLPA